MFKIEEDGTIHITRGDSLSLNLSAVDENGALYTFKSGDVIRLNVCAKKNTEDVVISESFTVGEETQVVTINISGSVTEIGNSLNKPKEYWYEVELNPDVAEERKTIVGYDEDGAKIFMVYPEGVMI